MSNLAEAYGELHAWFDWKEGIRVKVRYIDKQELAEWLNKSKQVKWNRKTHQSEESTDQPKWHRCISTAIVDWEGFTGKAARAVGPWPKIKLTEKVECNDANKIELLKRTLDFENFIYERITDIQTFQLEAEEDQKKTSASGQGTS